MRIAFAANDERTARRISDALGTATELRAQRNYAGHRLAPWLGHVMVSRQETARPLLTPGEVMQLPQGEAIVLVSGLAPVRARKLRHYEDTNFATRVLPPLLAAELYPDRPPPRTHDWQRERRKIDGQPAPTPLSDLTQDADAEGGPGQAIPIFDEGASGAGETALSAERFFEDDSDVASDEDQMHRAASGSATLRNAHAVTRDDDDLLPAF